VGGSRACAYCSIGSVDHALNFGHLDYRVEICGFLRDFNHLRSDGFPDKTALGRDKTGIEIREERTETLDTMHHNL